MTHLLAQFPGGNHNYSLPARPLLLLRKAHDFVKGGQHVGKRLAAACASSHDHVPAFQCSRNAFALNRSCSVEIAFLERSEKLWFEGQTAEVDAAGSDHLCSNRIRVSRSREAPLSLSKVFASGCR